MATLNVLSIDLHSNSLVIVRNNPAPVILIKDSNITLLDEPVDVVGVRREIRPSINEIPLLLNLVAVVFTDGLVHAGDRIGQRMDIVQHIKTLMAEGPPNPKRWAEKLIQDAVKLDQGRPSDDISVLVVAIVPRQGDEARQLTVRVPL
jgi:serine phosphatase RsbU (regulator of sigma subunit)